MSVTHPNATMRNPSTAISDADILMVLNELADEASDGYVKKKLKPDDLRGVVLNELIKRVTAKKI